MIDSVNVDQHVFEAFATLNLIRVDPLYSVRNIILPMKKRIFPRGPNNYIFKSPNSNEVIPIKGGWTAFENLIEDIWENCVGFNLEPLLWNNDLEHMLVERCETLKDKLIDTNVYEALKKV